MRGTQIYIKFCFVFGSFFSVRSVPTWPEDVLILISFKSNVENTAALSSWHGDPCGGTWQGVHCLPFSDSSAKTFQAVTQIDIEGFNVGGYLPPDLGVLSHLNSINLRGNNLRGNVAGTFGGSTVTYIDLSDNNLGGSINFSPTAPLLSLKMGGNNFSGSLEPALFAQMKSLKILDLANNHLSGPIPDTLSSLQNLEEVSLSNNSLSGPIPAFFTSLTHLSTLLLENNSLSGSLPPVLISESINGTLNLRLAGNPALCANATTTANSSAPLPFCSPTISVTPSVECNAGFGSTPELVQPRPCQCSSGQAGSQACNSVLGAWSPCSCLSKVADGSVVMSGVLRYVFPFLCALVTLSLVVCLLAICAAVRTRARQPRITYTASKVAEPGQLHVVIHKESASISTSPYFGYGEDGHKQAALTQGQEESEARPQPQPSLPVNLFSMEEMKAATGNFAEGNVLGTHGVAREYRAELADGRQAVVKEVQLSEQGQADVSFFLADVAELQGLSDRHLQRTLGCSVEEGARLLVLEHLPYSQGTLHSMLHCSLHQPQAHEDALTAVNGSCLDWNTRVCIVLGVAEALEYLHDRHPPVAHQCVSSIAVVLHYQLEPSLTDCALPSICGHSTPNSSPSINSAVACGMEAPELAWSPQFTRQSDVYAFGVLLLEVITGRKPFDVKRMSNEQALVRWARPRLTQRNRVESLVDPRLEGVYSSPALYQLALLTWQCLQVDPLARPTMQQVVELLRRLQNLPMDSPFLNESEVN